MQPGHLRKGMRQNFRQQILYRVGYFTLILEIASWIIIAGPTEKVQAATAEKMMAARMTDQTETGSRNEEDQTETGSRNEEDQTTAEDQAALSLDMLGDFSDIEKAVSEAMTVESSISFKEILQALMKGSLDSAGQMLGQMIKEQITGGIYENQQLLFKIACFAVIGAIFTNFAMAFSKEQVAETGFYLTYTLLMTLMMTSFIMTAAIITNVLKSLTGFMKVLLPTFCAALTFTTGSLLSGAYYELMMAAIAIADWLMSTLIMKLIQIYVLTALVNHISKEDYLSKLSELLALLIRWSIRTVVGVILGINILQTMLLPAIDRAKGTAAYKLISALPGVGAAMNTALGAVIGSGVLIRNVLGMGSLIVILLICVVPVVRVCMVFLSYKVVQAVIQPVTDKRLLDGMESMTQGVGMLLQVLIGCVLMFILSLAVVCNAASVIDI
ncbi:MAG: stage III sporulation protein AE [Coprococcus sp.]